MAIRENCGKARPVKHFTAALSGRATSKNRLRIFDKA
jgi:hypothetical protein